MIKNIHHSVSKPSNMDWWDWTEICDNCGEIIEDNNYLHSVPPEEHEVQFCVKCMREFLDNHMTNIKTIKRK